MKQTAARYRFRSPRAVNLLSGCLTAETSSTKGYEGFGSDNDQSGITAEWVEKAGRILHALDAAASPQDLAGVPGYRLHPLKGKRKETWSTTVSGNYRITFKWKNEGPYDVNLEDYHGK